MTVRPEGGSATMLDDREIPGGLSSDGAARLWALLALAGAGAGLLGGLLTVLLDAVQDLSWGAAPGITLLDAATRAGPWRHVALLVGAGVLTVIGQVLLKRLTSGNAIDIMAAIWFKAGRLPHLRTLGSAVLSIVIVGMGTSLGREGAPKQAGAVAGDIAADLGRLSDEQRRLIVSCGAGAGMAAAYGVPLGGALVALEVMRGALSLRAVLPALFTSAVSALVSWSMLPNAATYQIPSYTVGPSALLFALVAGPLVGVAGVGFVRAIAFLDHNKPKGWPRFVAPVIGVGLVGVISIPFPQVLGNGKDVAQLAMSGRIAPLLLIALVVAKPLSVFLCLGTGAPGGLFTPTLATGALLGGVLGQAWLLLWPGGEPGLFSVLGAGALLAATTQGPVSSIVLLMELTDRDRSFIAPLLIIVAAATLVARTIDPRSIYEAKLSDDAVQERLRARALRPGAD